MDSKYSTYSSSIDALRKLIQVKGNFIVNITPPDYSLSNGIEYCCVGVQCKERSMYLVQAYGKEARELCTESSLMAKELKVEWGKN